MEGGLTNILSDGAIANANGANNTGIYELLFTSSSLADLLITLNAFYMMLASSV